MNETAEEKVNWKVILDDKTTTLLTHYTPENKGTAFVDEDLEAYRERALQVAESMRRFAEHLDEEGADSWTAQHAARL